MYRWPFYLWLPLKMVILKVCLCWKQWICWIFYSQLLLLLKKHQDDHCDSSSSWTNAKTTFKLPCSLLLTSHLSIPLYMFFHSWLKCMWYWSACTKEFIFSTISPLPFIWELMVYMLFDDMAHFYSILTCNVSWFLFCF